jgi:hypothetical protein
VNIVLKSDDSGGAGAFGFLSGSRAILAESAQEVSNGRTVPRPQSAASRLDSVQEGVGEGRRASRSRLAQSPAGPRRRRGAKGEDRRDQGALVA